jgi:hypothetical protein
LTTLTVGLGRLNWGRHRRLTNPFSAAADAASRPESLPHIEALRGVAERHLEGRQTGAGYGPRVLSILRGNKRLGRMQNVTEELQALVVRRDDNGNIETNGQR